MRSKQQGLRAPQSICGCEAMERRLLYSATISRPGTPRVENIAAAGANEVVWSRADDNDGGKIDYTLFYSQPGTGINTPVGTTVGNSLPLCNGSPSNSIVANTDYIVWVQAQDEVSLITSNSHPREFRTAASLTPTDIRKAYGLTSLYHSGFQGQKQIIGLVELGMDPTLANDIAGFDRSFHLRPPNLTVIPLTGTEAPTSTDAGAAQEIALDVEWAHAIAPDATLVVVEGGSASVQNNIQTLMDAATQAVEYKASVVSISYGYSEAQFNASTASTVAELNSTFQTEHVVFVAAAGDSFGQPGWPSVSPDVISVGGTQLSVGSGDAYKNEVLWHDLDIDPTDKGSGSSYGQFGSLADPTARQTPDVVYAADGFAWYHNGLLNQEGIGTSFGAPQWAALIAIANQGRKNLGDLDSNVAGNPAWEIQNALAAAPAEDFHDNSAAGRQFASQGRSLVTGLGSPTGKLIRFLMHYP